MNQPSFFSPSDERSINCLVNSLETPPSVNGAKSSESLRKSLIKAVQEFSEASCEIFDKMTEILDEHRRFKSLQFFEKIEKKSVSFFNKFTQRKKYITAKYSTKSDLPRTILSQDAFVDCFKTYLKKLISETEQEETDVKLVEALRQLDIKQLNHIYFILSRYSHISTHSTSFEKGDVYSIYKVLSAVEDILFSISFTEISKPRTSLSRDLSTSSPLEGRILPAKEDKSYIPERKLLLESLQNISKLENSDIFFAAYSIYISHKQGEPEAASFFLEFSEFIEAYNRALYNIQMPRKDETEIKENKSLLSPRSPRQPQLKEQQKHTESDFQDRTLTPAKAVKQKAIRLITQIKEGKFNIEAPLIKRAAEMLERYIRIREFTYSDAKELLEEVKGRLKENCQTRLGYANITYSPNLDDTVFIMSEPFFRICSERGIPVFTRKELKHNALIKGIQSRYAITQ